MNDLSFGKQEELHWLAAYLAHRVELYGQQGEDRTEAEFFLDLLYDYYRNRQS